MSNVHIFENIGYQCSTSDNIVLQSVLPNYQEFKAENVEAYVPYLVRDNKNKQYEIGIAQLKAGDTYYLIRQKIISSSNDGNAITIKGGEFYIFANEYNFNTAFNNVLVKDTNFDVDNIRALYIVDTSKKGKLSATLPCAKDSPSLIIDFKLINNSLGKLDIYCCENDLLFTIKGLGRYATIASTGEEWVLLQEPVSDESQRLSSLNYSVQSDPGGEDGEIQYKVDGTNFSGANVFFGTDNKLLFGSETESSANIVLPTTGNVEQDTIFNQQYSNSGNFVVYGTGIDNNFKFGSDGGIGVNIPSGYSVPSSGDVILFGNDSGNRNMFFAYDGRLGINIPTGSRPQTLAHFVNFSCDETLRIENKASCHTADITLYHAPAAQIIEKDTDISTLTFSSKDSTQSKHTYAKIFGRVLDYTDGSTSGQLSLTVNSGNSLIETLVSNPKHTRISTLSSESIADLNGDSIGFFSENITFSGNAINFVGKDGTSGTVNFANVYIGDTITADELVLPNFSNTNLLTIANGQVAAAATGNPISIVGAPSGRILTTTNSGIVSTDFKTSDFFQTNSDIVYSAYPKRLAEACLSQIIFDSDDLPNVEEYSVGDQISIESDEDSIDTIYTTVTNITADDGDNITIMFTSDQITPNTSTGLKIQSISKGFILTLQKYVDPELSGVNDSTATILSTRPFEDTIFNTSAKPIRFIVNTDSDVPGLDIRPSTISGNSITNGEYYAYATENNIAPLQILISSGGVGAGNNYNTANYNYASLGKWSGLLSDVGTNGLPSSYGTFDQDGNAAELIAENTLEHRTTDTRYAAGGSILTTGNPFNTFEIVNSTGVASGIGFRLASAYAYTDSTYVTGTLGLDFVSVGNPKNISISSGLNVYDKDTDSISISFTHPDGRSISDLGRVSSFYRIGTKEVTNSQYASFLNSVATGTDLFSLYDTEMSSDDTGGITRNGSGPYSYSVKEFHDHKPVTFISYISALRFSNWLHNGAPTGLTEDAANITESGAYNIQLDAGTTYSIIKNSLASYYLPDLDEWYKSAYFEPTSVETSSSNVVTINSEEPYLDNILTIGGKTHIEGDFSVSGDMSLQGLSVKTTGGDSIIGAFSHTDSEVGIQSQQINSLALVNSANGRVTIGPNPTLEIDTGDATNRYNGSYRTGFSPDKVTIAASGQIKIMSDVPVLMSGLDVDKLLVSDLKVTDPEGNVQDFISGPSGGILYKRTSARAEAIPRFSYVESEDQILFTGVDVSGLSPLFVDNFNYIKGYENITYNSDNIAVKALLKINNRDDFQIGDNSPSLKGALLVHQGEGPLKFELNKYLEAEGLTYNRFEKRLVEVNVDNKRIKFVEPVSSIGGIASGLPDLTADLPTEYKFGDTVAIMHTGDFEVEYVKLAANLTGPFDGPDNLYIDHPPIFFEDEDSNIFTHFCPKVKGNETDPGGDEAPVITGIMYSITRSATLTNGLGYGLFAQDPVATSGFDCAIADPVALSSADATFSFRPSSKNVLSTRPMEHTHFNAVGENIDFVVYGRTKTLYNRYTPSLHDTDPNDGELPAGLVPVFRADANIPNAAVGTATGVFNSGFIDPLNTIPTGFDLEDIGKICINRDDAYVIASLSKDISSEPAGYNTLDVLADLSVNQYTYSSGIVTDHVYLSGMHGTEYIPGATLTVDVYGKVVSVAPDLPPSIPGPPLNVNGDPGNSAVFLRWTTPRDDGRSVILDYVVEYSLNDGEVWTEVPDTISNENSLIVTNLVNDQRYIFRVAAVNSLGTGQYSLSSDGITPTANVPSSVTNVTLDREPLTEVDDRITVNWAPPQNNGTSDIVRYIIKYRKTSENAFAASRTISLDVGNLNLVNGSYSYAIQESGYITTEPHILFQIFAVNNSGNGTLSEKTSLGTDPVDPPPTDPPNDEYDFGEMKFTGECTT